jgi:hypothetical protein
MYVTFGNFDFRTHLVRPLMLLLKDLNILLMRNLKVNKNFLPISE